MTIYMNRIEREYRRKRTLREMTLATLVMAITIIIAGLAGWYEEQRPIMLEGVVVTPLDGEP